MQHMEEWEQVKNEYKSVEIPKDGSHQVLEAMARAKRDRIRLRHLSRYATVAAAMLLILILPNANSNVASAMAEVPVLGGFFRLITIERYTDSTETAVLDAEVPKLETMYDTTGLEEQKYSADKAVTGMGTAEVLYGSGSVAAEVQQDTAILTQAPQASAVESLNKEISEYVSGLVKEYEQDKAAGNSISQTVSYEIVTDTENWFSIRLCAETVKADGYMEYTYYTMHSDTKERIYLTDLLCTDADRLAVAEEVMRQMQERMAQKGDVFFVEQLEQDIMVLVEEMQNFYINEEGHLVIVYNEFEVAPGYMGCVEFAIPDELVPGLK